MKTHCHTGDSGETDQLRSTQSVHVVAHETGPASTQQNTITASDHNFLSPMSTPNIDLYYHPHENPLKCLWHPHTVLSPTPISVTHGNKIYIKLMKLY